MDDKEKIASDLAKHVIDKQRQVFSSAASLAEISDIHNLQDYVLAIQLENIMIYLVCARFSNHMIDYRKEHGDLTREKTFDIYLRSVSEVMSGIREELVSDKAFHKALSISKEAIALAIREKSRHG